MESFLANVGILVVFVFFMGVTFLFPVTVAYTVAVIYLMKVGLAGYFLVGSGETMLATYAGVAIVFCEILYLANYRFKK